MKPIAQASAPSAGGRACRLSVLMPAYNEAENIGAAAADVVEQVFSRVPDAELLIVDDGSRDDTGTVADAWAGRDARIRVIRQANAGHGPALVNGARAARGDYCLLLDSDRQIGLMNFGETWQLVHGQDAVLGVRSARSDPMHRLLLTALLRMGLALALRVRSPDANVPYKLLRRDLLLEAIGAMPDQPLVPSILLTLYLKRRGARVVEQEVPQFARSAGKSTLNLRRLTAFCGRALVELLRFDRSLRRHSDT